MPQISNIIRSKRKTIALVIQPNGDLLVRAPQRATLKQINTMVDEHANWIAKKQAKALAAQAAYAPHQFLAGEIFSFLGENYPLQYISQKRPVFELNGNFQMAQSARGQARQIFEKWYKVQARQVFTDRIGYFAGEYGFEYGKLRLSSARTRWGSCSAKGTISLTWRLVMAPMEIIDYVVVHELSHLREHNHSRNFWAQVGAILPDYKRRRKWMKENGRNYHWP